MYLNRLSKIQDAGSVRQSLLLEVESRHLRLDLLDDRPLIFVFPLVLSIGVLECWIGWFIFYSY